MELKIDSWGKDYLKVIDYIKKYGEAVSPRGQETIEVSPLTIVSDNPRERLIMPYNRNMNLAFGLREISDHVENLNPGYVIRYNSVMKNYTNDSGRLVGSYADRIHLPEQNQIERAIRQIEKDPDTRRAIISIHNPLLEEFYGKDVACTMSLALHQRKDKLNMHAYMRSSDSVRGLTYDTFEFQYLQEMIAGRLGLDVGKYIHTNISSHIYTKDLDQIDTWKQRNLYEKHKPVDCRLDAGELRRDWNAKEAAEHYAREGHLVEAMRVLDSIHNDYYKSWAGTMIFEEQRRFAKDLAAAKKALFLVSNEFKEWCTEKLEVSKLARRKEREGKGKN